MTHGNTLVCNRCGGDHHAALGHGEIECRECEAVGTRTGLLIRWSEFLRNLDRDAREERDESDGNYV